jgi:hypothetical protein
MNFMVKCPRCGMWEFPKETEMGYTCGRCDVALPLDSEPVDLVGAVARAQAARGKVPGA